MSDEPLYCTHCGNEWGDGHNTGCWATMPEFDDTEDGHFCHICGVGNVTGGFCQECSAEFGADAPGRDAVVTFLNPGDFPW